MQCANHDARVWRYNFVAYFIVVFACCNCQRTKANATSKLERQMLHLNSSTPRPYIICGPTSTASYRSTLNYRVTYSVWISIGEVLHNRVCTTITFLPLAALDADGGYAFCSTTLSCLTHTRYANWDSDYCHSKCRCYFR